jgi:hypothetical protein
MVREPRISLRSSGGRFWIQIDSQLETAGGILEQLEDFPNRFEAVYPAESEF